MNILIKKIFNFERRKKVLTFNIFNIKKIYNYVKVDILIKRLK